ncbi:hypothetical protein D0C16_14735 [Cellvibrio sp. KY-GH-1]|uniref:hypothetical protein n=1 Tax=Cellvibrio sp. KY-GH-1 TaxID=2303332 RepID=UPI0012486CBB|nr:hypothetical protein [Cellvibrio sp. KY-GH-1]QEY17123.1 hypothetical protein D0C16_14735 [Cellvibrio sp. KY-GH-1]
MADYSFALLFNKKPKKNVVTDTDFQVTNLTTKEPLPTNQMPEEFLPGDTITFVVANSTKCSEINSALYTSYPVNGSLGPSPFAPPYDRASIDFIAEDLFGKPLEVARERKGSWIFHLLGLYTYKGKKAAYYLDPEVTTG